VNWIFTIGGPTAKRALEDPTIKAGLDAQAKQMRQHIWHLPIKRGTTALKFVPEYEDWLIEARQHGDLDDYWKQVGLIALASIFRAAIFRVLMSTRIPANRCNNIGE
jgi:hypothetical protein